MLEITIAVALTIPNCRSSVAGFFLRSTPTRRAVLSLSGTSVFIVAKPGLVRLNNPAGRKPSVEIQLRMTQDDD
jgi:hypothetical protein